MARSVVASVLVAAVAIVATAFLTADAARTGVEREQVRVADVDRAIVTRLETYGRSHGGWSGAGPLLDDLATSAERVIVVTDADGEPLASSAGAADDHPVGGDPTALLDPLGPIVAAATRTVPTSYDALALPDLLLSSRPAGAELREALEDDGRLVGVCLESEIGEEAASGLPDSVVLTTCRELLRDAPGAGAGAVDDLFVLHNTVARREHDCLERRGIPVQLVGFFGEEQSEPDLLTAFAPAAARPTRLQQAWRDCATAVLTRELGRWVAPGAVLYVSETREVQRGGLVERVGGARIVVALALILGVAVVASVVASRRVLLPVRRLTEATQEMAAGRLDAQVAVSGDDEVARLGRSFNDMAQALVEADGQRKRMVGDIAHELRTPLSNLRGYLEAGHDGVLERDDAWTESLLEEVGILQHVVDDLAVLTAADVGRLGLHRVEADVVATVEAALLAMRSTADSRGVELARTGDGTAVVLHDPIRVRQIVSNLVSNAVRHSPAGSTVAVDVRAVPADPGPAGVVIEVTDEGEGLAENDLLRVFERFYRADPSRARETGGSGLGLSIVQQLTEAHGGSVAAANRAGRGAVLTVRLPADTRA